MEKGRVRGEKILSTSEPFWALSQLAFVNGGIWTIKFSPHTVTESLACLAVHESNYYYKNLASV